MKNYFRIISSHKKLILLIIILCGILSFIAAKVIPTTYTASTLLLVHRTNKIETKDFQYDNYYSIQATEAVGNTVASLLQSPELILEIYKKAKLENTIKNISSDVKKFRPKQISSHLIRLRVTTQNSQDSEKLIKAGVEVLQNRISQLETNYDKKGSFEISAENPIVFANKYSPLTVTILGLICGLFLGIALAFLFEYFREEEKKI